MLFDMVFLSTTEVDAHPPFRSLLEHKAYLRPWLPTACSHVDFRNYVFLLGDSVGDSGLFFQSMPAAQEIETRGLYCYFTTMACSNRWTRASGSTAQASTGPFSVPDDDGDDDGHTTAVTGYATRRSEEISPNNTIYLAQ